MRLPKCALSWAMRRRAVEGLSQVNQEVRKGVGLRRVVRRASIVGGVILVDWSRPVSGLVAFGGLNGIEWFL